MNDCSRGDCCSSKANELTALAMHADVRRMLIVVLAINLGMFIAEFVAGVVAHSTSLMADSVDMLGDALVYILSLYALERGPRWRAGAALVKGILIAAFAVGVGLEVVLKLRHGVTPQATLMSIFGAIALTANLSCLALLYRHRRRDLNMASTFECSRNDVIANVGVLVAALGVRFFDAGWPDVLVGSVIAILFGRSAVVVMRAAWPEFSAGEATAGRTS
jgi:Co/Zn/Cd efflux system component